MASAPPTSKKNRVVKRYCFAIVLWSSDQMYFQKKLNSGWCACDACASPGTLRANISAITTSYNYLLYAGGNFLHGQVSPHLAPPDRTRGTRPVPVPAAATPIPALGDDSGRALSVTMHTVRLLIRCLGAFRRRIKRLELDA